MNELHKDLSLEEEARSFMQFTVQNTSKERLKELATLNKDLAQIVASNIYAPPELLAELVSHKDKAVRKAVISNPNNYLETLFKLGAQDFPREILDNPIFQLSYLENPDFVKDIPFYIFHALLQLEDIPNFLLNYVQKGYQRPMVVEALQMHVAIAGEMSQGWHEAADKKIDDRAYQTHYFNFFNRLDFLQRLDFEFLSYFVEFVPEKIFADRAFRMAVAKNPKTPPKILKQFSRDRHVSTKTNVAGNTNTPANVLRELADYSVVETRQAVANNKNAPVNALRKLAKDKTDRIRETVARNENTPVNVLEILAEDKNDKVRESVARNWSTPASILNKLAADKAIKVCKEVAYRKNTSPNILKKLAIDDNIRVRQGVAWNSNTPTDVLEQLATDKSSEVRRGTARNGNTPVYVLDKLATDRDSIVRLGVAENSNLPSAISDRLANDRDLRVKEALVGYWNHNPPVKILEEFVTHPDELIRRKVAYSHKSPVNVLEALATDENWQVRETVARNKNTPTHILEQLAKDRDDIVRAGVAERENLPYHFFKQLANDEQSRVRCQIAENPNTPIEILKVLAVDRENNVYYEAVKNPRCTPEIRKTIFKNLAQSKTPSFLRYVLFLSDYAESSVLAENSDSISWLERYAIACNAETPEDTLKKLAQDGNRIVRATAKESLQKYY